MSFSTDKKIIDSETQFVLNSVKEVCPSITEAELSQYALKFKFIELKKKDLFLQSGETQKLLGFVTKGLVRSFYIDKDGNERTIGFYAEGDYATHYPSFIIQKPSKYSIQCLEPTTFACLSFDDLQWLYKQSQNFEKYGRLIAEEVLRQQQARIESFVFQAAEERYLDFIQYRSALFNRVSLSHLCSYLGIERQSLTRIRQKVAHK
ncbi:Crp/Fnr family transcriptional regulator [Dyadobacter fanqingshengii]|uniref:Crp/Fnr family transcriptional regulator n=1 Tax=Dyadobacter fanqingshengii TaxID=2906443 RepID=A0A9X1PAI0_9BACT|nr:Crp/Fnr family transcriptional regulator [Dyadobacter fanqingshengii]MCF0039732.1 Crp/Fnr family transcriptional regulator [Dyadobacter fanqingshengii]USJ38505.1 Crp/Fnr family transcriptional regulator [Dyadobacter fanqingshengii]